MLLLFCGRVSGVQGENVCTGRVSVEVLAWFPNSLRVSSEAIFKVFFPLVMEPVTESSTRILHICRLSISRQVLLAALTSKSVNSPLGALFALLARFPVLFSVTSLTSSTISVIMHDSSVHAARIKARLYFHLDVILYFISGTEVFYLYTIEQSICLLR